MRASTAFILISISISISIAQVASAGPTALVSGRLIVPVQGLDLVDAGSIVVFLVPEGDTPQVKGAQLSEAQLRQHGARFEPSFLAVSVGQRVGMPNDDVIFHNVFSYSEPNSFDLGLYASGESRSVRFEHPGLVRVYCSIHEEMDASVFVAPTPLFAIPSSTGHYVIPDVPMGRYRLHVWSMRLPEVVRSIALETAAVTMDVELGVPDR